MAGPYDIYPAVDLSYAFPPEVRTAAANSAELKLVLDSNVAAAVAAAKVNPAFTGNVTVPDLGDGTSDNRAANTRFVGTATANARVNPAFSGNVTVPDITDPGANDTRAANTKFVQAISTNSKVNPTFSGNVNSSNPNSDENNTRVATMASVRGAMGLYGLGTEAKLASGDWNNYLATGFYRGLGLGSSPNGSTWFFVEVQRHDDSYVTQTATGFAGDVQDRTFMRTKISGNWGVWKELYKGNSAGFDSSTNWNDLQTPGAHRGNNSAGGPNGPGGYGWGTLSVVASNIGVGIIQMWYPDASGVLAIRGNWGGNWGGWRRIYTTATQGDFPTALFNGASGSVYGSREGRLVTLNFNVYVGSGFGINGVGTIATIPDGHRPVGQNVEVALRTSDSYTVWGSINRDNGNLDWRAGGTGGGYVSPGNYIYGMVTYWGQY